MTTTGQHEEDLFGDGLVLYLDYVVVTQSTHDKMKDRKDKHYHKN